MKNWAHDPVASTSQSKSMFPHSELSISHKTGKSQAICIAQHAVTEEEENHTEANCILFQLIISVHNYLCISIKTSYEKPPHACMTKHYF